MAWNECMDCGWKGETLTPTTMEELIDRIIQVSSEKEGKTAMQLILKLMEESGEVAEALLSYEKACGCAYKEKTLEDVGEEAVDVLLVILAFMTRIGMTKEQIKLVVETKLTKWQKVIG